MVLSSLGRQVSQMGALIRWWTPSTQLQIQQQELPWNYHYRLQTQTSLNSITHSLAGMSARKKVPGSKQACPNVTSVPLHTPRHPDNHYCNRVTTSLPLWYSLCTRHNMHWISDADSASVGVEAKAFKAHCRWEKQKYSFLCIRVIRNQDWCTPCLDSAMVYNIWGGKRLS